MLLPGAFPSMKIRTEEEGDSTGNIRQFTAPRLEGRWLIENNKRTVGLGGDSEIHLISKEKEGTI